MDYALAGYQGRPLWLCPLFLRSLRSAVDIRNHLAAVFALFLVSSLSLDLRVAPAFLPFRPFLGSFAPLARGVLRDSGEIHGLSHSPQARIARSPRG